jgi:hypothetical protein
MHHIPRALFVLVPFFVLKAVRASGAVMPYVNTFDGSDIQGGINGALSVEQADEQWTVSSGFYRNTATITSTGTKVSYAVEQFTNAFRRDFSASTEFTYVNPVFTNGATGSTYTLGLTALTDSTLATGISADVTLAAGGNLNRLRILNLSNTGTALAVEARDANFTLIENTPYRLSLTGAYDVDAGTLALTLRLLNPATNASRSLSYTTTPEFLSSIVANEYFGFRGAASGANFGTEGTATYTTSFQEYALIPEPSTGLSLLTGTAMLGLRRRRVA